METTVVNPVVAEKPAIPAVVTEKPAEGTPEKPTEAPAKNDEALSSRFAALSKREKAALRAKQEAKAEIARLEETKKAISEREAKIKEWEDLKDPVEALKRKGWTYDDVTNRVLEDKIPVEKKISDLERQIADDRAAATEKERKSLESQKADAQAKLDEQVQVYKNNLIEFVKGQPDEYELINSHGEQESVFDLVVSHYQRTAAEDPKGIGKVLSQKEAADLVESQLEKQAMTLLETKKIKGKLGLKTEEKNPDGTEKKPEPSKTLSHDRTTSTVPSLLPPKTEEERIQRALAALG